MQTFAEELREITQDLKSVLTRYTALRERMLEASKNSKTDDDLVEEFKRWVAGEMDAHDQAVAEVKQSMRRAFAEEEIGLDLPEGADSVSFAKLQP